MFEKTDMARQRRLLSEGVNWLILAARGRGYAVSQVEKLGKLHGREGLRVSPGLYELWIDSLLKAVAKHDPNFNPTLESAWRAVLDVGISMMMKQY
jgi:hypothetical protein